MSSLAALDLVAVAKTAAVVLVSITFLVICLRAWLARPGDVRRGAGLPLEDLDPNTPQPKA